jgi:hypothetical protein
MSVISLERGAEQSVEALLRRISTLVAQRQDLRGEADNAAQLERNRLEIVRCQSELNHALIELYAKRAA